jgi:anti-sigma factor RsiW
VNCNEYRECAAADADGVLGAAEEEARRHLERCAGCRAERDRQLAVRGLLRSRARDLHPATPVGLRTRVLATLDEAHAASERGWWSSAVRWGGVVAFTVAVVLTIVVWNRNAPFTPLIREYDRAANGSLELALRTAKREDLEAYYRQHAAEGIPVHVVDLSAAGFRLVGGAVADLRGRRARLSVYSDGRYTIVCDYRFAESFSYPLPASGEPVFFARGGASFCARRIGDEVCLLVTRMPMEIFRRKVGGGTESG